MAGKIDISNTMNNYRSDMNKILNKYYDKTDQVTSGNKYKYYSDLAKVGKTNFKIANENSLENAKSFLLTNSMEYKEMEIISDQLQALYELNEEMARQIIERKTPIGHLRNLTQITKSDLTSIKTILETKFSGRSLFFGSNTKDTQIGDIVNNSNIINGQITANYSVGDNYKKTIKYMEGEPMEYGILDHDETFQKMIAYHHYILEFERTKDNLTLDKAFNLYKETEKGLSNLITKLGTQMKTIENIQQKHISLERSTQEALEKEFKPNPAELIAEINELQYILNSSYKVFSMVTKNTNLAEYL